MGQPIVSVIMTVYNGERFLVEAIRSILVQSLTDFEFLIMDDCSTDDTARIIHSFQDPRIRYLRTERNVGAAAARNLALGETRGRYVTGMDADDISLTDRLERQARFLDTHPAVGLVACGWESIDEQGKFLFRFDWGEADRTPINEVVDWHPCLVGPTYFFRRECIDQVGMYRPGLEMNEDYDLCVRIGERYEIGVLGGISYKYRVHDTSACAQKVAKNIQSIILVRRLAEERRLTGIDRLSGLSEAKVRRFFRLYFYPYDKCETAGLPLRYFQLTNRIVRTGGSWSMATKYLIKGILANPLRVSTLKLGLQYLAAKRRFKRLGEPKKTAIKSEEGFGGRNPIPLTKSLSQ